MAGQHQIHFGSEVHHASARALFDQCWRPGFWGFRENIFKWLYRENPFLPPELEESTVMATVDGTVVGFLGLIPSTFHVLGKQVAGAYPGNWLVHPDYRGHGIGAQLFRHAMDHFPVVAGTAVRQTGREVLKSLGFRYLHDIPRWVGILDPAQAAALCAGDESERRRIMERRVVSLNQHRWDIPRVGGWRSFEAAMDELWSRLAVRMPVAASHNSAYMNWRYVHHPALQYHYIALGSPDRWEGVAVCRIEQVQERSERVMRLVEFLAEPHAQIPLAAACVEDGLAQGCAFIDFHGLAEHMVSGLVEVGFFQHQEEPGIQIPYRFQPLDHRPNQNFWAWSSIRDEQGISPTSFLNLWYLSRGEGDQDRPK